MAEPETHEPQPGPEAAAARPSPVRRPVRGAAIAWAAGVASFALTWVQHLRQVPHPHPLPLVLLLGTMTVAAVASLGSGLRLAATGPRRLPALLWAAIALLPPLAWASVGLYAQQQWRQRLGANDPPMGPAKGLGVTPLRPGAAHQDPKPL